MDPQAQTKGLWSLLAPGLQKVCVEHLRDEAMRIGLALLYPIGIHIASQKVRLEPPSLPPASWRLHENVSNHRTSGSLPLNL